MTTRYSAGRELEYRVRDLLRDRGYLVIRSAGSKGIADLVALPRIDSHPETGLSGPLLVQCKRGGVMPPREWNEMLTEALSASCTAVLACYTPRKPIELYRLVGFKEPRGRHQPMVRIFTGQPTEPAATM